MKRILFLLVIVFSFSCEQNQVPEKQLKIALSSEDFKELLLTRKWQIDKGFINEVQVIEAGMSISALVDVEVDDRVTWIEFNKDNPVEMRFDEVDRSLTMQYEIAKEAVSMRIFPARGIQDFLQKENWILENISSEEQSFEMVFNETVSGIEVTTKLVLKRI